MSALGRPAPARTAFAEARFMRVLERPLVVEGQLSWLGGDSLERRVERPHPETATIAGGKVTQQREGRPPRSFSLERAPELQTLLDSFVALLGGDAARLQGAFKVHVWGTPRSRWTLDLLPLDPRVAKVVASIHVDGNDNQPGCVRVLENDGDLTVDLLGGLAARMPAQPTREALDALCQGGR